MPPPRRRLDERLVPEEDLRVVTDGRLVDDSIRGTIEIGLTDRRLVCLSPDGDLVDVEYATISTIRSFTRSRLAFEGIDRRLLILGLGGLATLLVAVAAITVAATTTGDEQTVATVLVGLTGAATLAALFGHRLWPTAVLAGSVRWGRERRASLSRHRKRIGSARWRLRDWTRRHGRQASRWSRRRTIGLVRWSGDRLRSGYWWSRARLSTAAWWCGRGARSLSRWCRACVGAGYRLYATRTDRPLAPLARRLAAAVGSAPVRLIHRGIRACWRVLGTGGAGVVSVARAGLAGLRRLRVRRWIRSRSRSGRAFGGSLSHGLRSRVPVVSRPRFSLSSRRSLRSASRSAPDGGRRWPRALAGIVAAGSFVSLVAVSPAPLAALALFVAVCCLAILAYARRFETDCAGVQFTRLRETELSIHTVDGDTVRLLLDPETDLDVELSRSAAAVPRTTPEPQNAGSVAE